MFQRLDEAGSFTAAELLAEADLAALASETRPYVFFNFVATLDGRTTIDGSSRPLGGECDLEMLLALRSAADAVLIGPSTVRAEGYARLLSPQRSERTPLAVLISRSSSIPWDAGLFAAVDQPVVVYGPIGAPDPPAVAAPVEVVRLEDCTPAAMLIDLRRRGVRALLSEGGPRLYAAFAAAGRVDELFLTLSPLVTSDESARTLAAGDRLAEPARFEARWVLRGGADLFLRYATLR